MAPADAERQRARDSFAAAAGRYQRARPEYPPELIGSVIRRARLTRGSQLLEAGCATGKATLPLARRGYAITALELSQHLAAEARRNLARYPRVRVITSPFETWPPPPGQRYDLVFAANVWHWLDPAVRWRRAADLLRPGGTLALWNALHVFPPGGDPFFTEIQEVYDEIGEGYPPGAAVFPRPGELADYRAEMDATGLFTDISAEHFHWVVSYTADGYIDLLRTFSGFLVLDGWKQDRLSSEIRRRLALRPHGLVDRGWGSVLNVARRAGPVPLA
jgi:SAM-dependent methyltransferase